MNDLVFDCVNTKEKFQKWREFAASFEHDDPSPITPIINVSKKEDGKLVQFGYFSIFTQPIIFPSFHPKFTTPRNFVDMVTAFSNFQCMSSISDRYPNGCSHVGLMTNGLPVGREYVTRLGYENTGMEIHKHIP